MLQYLTVSSSIEAEVLVVRGVVRVRAGRAVTLRLPGRAGILAPSRLVAKCSDWVAPADSLHWRCALAGRGLTFTTRPAASPFGPSAKPTFTSLREDVLSTKKVSKESDPCGALWECTLIATAFFSLSCGRS